MMPEQGRGAEELKKGKTVKASIRAYLTRKVSKLTTSNPKLIRLFVVGGLMALTTVTRATEEGGAPDPTTLVTTTLAVFVAVAGFAMTVLGFRAAYAQVRKWLTK